MPQTTADELTTTPLTPSLPRSTAELKDLVLRAQAGDATTIPVLRRLFENPQFVDALGGDLAREAIAQVVDRLAGNDHRIREAVLRKLELLRQDLGTTQANALDRLLVERVVACWLHLHYLELTASEFSSVAERHHKHIQRAHQNYLSAIKTLATVRKLARPTIHVRIAQESSTVPNPTNGA